MNSLQITQILASNPATRSRFLGCTPCDLIPFGSRFPFFVIVNTDEARKPGRHWVLIYAQDRDTAEYFDSFGAGPNPHIQRYLRSFKRVIYSNQKVQEDTSQACAIFCILYAIQRSKGQKAGQIISTLKRLNPTLIEEFIQ